jgi:hypothetical protein
MTVSFLLRIGSYVVRISTHRQGIVTCFVVFLRLSRNTLEVAVNTHDTVVLQLFIFMFQ